MIRDQFDQQSSQVPVRTAHTTFRSRFSLRLVDARAKIMIEPGSLKTFNTFHVVPYSEVKWYNNNKQHTLSNDTQYTDSNANLFLTYKYLRPITH